MLCLVNGALKTAGSSAYVNTSSLSTAAQSRLDSGRLPKTQKKKKKKKPTCSPIICIISASHPLFDKQNPTPSSHCSVETSYKHHQSKHLFVSQNLRVPSQETKTRCNKCCLFLRLKANNDCNKRTSPRVVHHCCLLPTFSGHHLYYTFYFSQHCLYVKAAIVL